MTIELLAQIDVATWLRMVGYVSLFMMCFFAMMQWRKRLRVLAVAGMLYCFVRIVTNVFNALALAQFRAVIDVITVLSIYFLAFSLAVTIYVWLRFELRENAR